MDDKATAILKFQAEYLALVRRWLEESDLEAIDLVHASVDMLNQYCQTGGVEFEADSDFLDKATEE